MFDAIWCFIRNVNWVYSKLGIALTQPKNQTVFPMFPVAQNLTHCEKACVLVLSQDFVLHEWSVTLFGKGRLCYVILGRDVERTLRKMYVLYKRFLGIHFVMPSNTVIKANLRPRSRKIFAHPYCQKRAPLREQKGYIVKFLYNYGFELSSFPAFISDVHITFYEHAALRLIFSETSG